MMNAAVYSSFSSPIEIKSVPRPTLSNSPKDAHAVIIEVKATGVCRSDWHGWKGHDNDIHDHGLPFIPGHEFSGIITEKGSLVHNVNLEIGDKVAVPFILSCGSCYECNVGKPTVCLHQEQPGFTCYGSFAEYVRVDRAVRNVRRIPSGVSFVEAAALGCRFTTAFRAVIQQGLGLGVDNNITYEDKTNNNSGTVTHHGNGRMSDYYPMLPTSQWLQREKTVAIFGCGGLGLSCIMIAKAFQNEGNINKIIAIDISSKALDKAKELGADEIVNTSKLFDQSNQSINESIMKLTNGLGAEISIDAAGFQSTCENALYCTRRGCRMVQVGLPIGKHRPSIDMGFVAGREIEIVGSHGFAATELPLLLRLVKEKRLDVRKLIEKEVGLEEGVQTLMNMDNSSPLGMTMITNFAKSLQSKL